MSIFHRVAAVVAVLASITASAVAADVTQPKPLPKQIPTLANPWEFQFTPYAWLIFVTGNQTVGATTTNVDTNIFDILNKSDHLYAWMSYQELRNGPFSIYNDTIWSRMRFSDTKSGVLPIGPLNRSSVSIVASAKIWLDFAIVESGATYEVIKWQTGGALSSGGFVPTAAIDFYAGARYWFLQPDMNLNVTATVSVPALNLSRTGAGSISAEKTIDWWDPLVGLRLRYQPARGQEIIVKGDVGGFDVGSKFTWQTLAAYSFETSLANLKWTNYIGYRALSIDYQQGNGDRTVGLNYIIHGPVIGLTFKW